MKCCLQGLKVIKVQRMKFFRQEMKYTVQENKVQRMKFTPQEIISTR